MLDGGFSPNAALNLLTRQAVNLLNPSPQPGEGDRWAEGLKGNSSPGQQDCILPLLCYGCNDCWSWKVVKELVHSVGCVPCRATSPNWCLGQIHSLGIVKLFVWDETNSAFFMTESWTKASPASVLFYESTRIQYSPLTQRQCMLAEKKKRHSTRF